MKDAYDLNIDQNLLLSQSTFNAVHFSDLGTSYAPRVYGEPPPPPPFSEEDARKCASNMLYFLHHNFVKDKKTKKYSWVQDEHYPATRVHEYYLRMVPLYAQYYLKNDGPCVKIESPAYVFGDLHGNYRDLIRFSKALGMFYNPRSTPAKFVFLGGIFINIF